MVEFYITVLYKNKLSKHTGYRDPAPDKEHED
jgi:hypothetical protein